jgi:hypothetical protein
MLVVRRLVLLTLAIAVFAPSLLGQAAALQMSKSFTPSTVAVGGTSTTTMTVTITNPNGSSVTGISFSDTYPAGLVPDVVGAYTCSPGSALFNGSGFAFNNVTLAPGASCSVPMMMHASTGGQIVNTTSQATGTGVPAGGPASATLNAVAGGVPTLSGWMLVALAMTIAAVAATRARLSS